MTKFRKKPVVIEARQWQGGNYEWLSLFCGRNWGRAQAVASWPSSIKDKEEVMVFNTGQMMWLPVFVGDWIVRAQDGELYPIRPETFAATYEAVEDSSHDPS